MGSSKDWSPSEGDAEITKLKDGCTALAYKAENAVDMETGGIVAVTTDGGAAADTATVEATVIEAGVAVAELLTAEPPEGKYQVHPGGVEEVVADTRTVGPQFTGAKTNNLRFRSAGSG